MPKAPAVSSQPPPQEIQVVPGDAPAAAPPRPGSARERLSESLRKIAKTSQFEAPPSEPQPPTPTPPPAPAPTPPKPAAPPSEEPLEEVKAQSEPGEEIQPGTPPEEPPKGEKGKKVSPWKLVDEWKKRAAEAEARAEEASRNLPSPEEAQRREAEAKAREDRLNELENEIRYVNWRKSQDYQKNFKEPYEAKWSKAIAELNEIPVAESEDGPTRQFQPADLLQLVNMSLPQARAMANQLFGDFADDVMRHRNDIRNMADDMASAEEKFRKEGVEMEKQRMEQFRGAQQEAMKMVSDVWNKANESIVKHEKLGRFFKAPDGDEEAAERLATGFKLADEAMKENPFNPRLKPEQRANVIRAHAALRNKAAAFGHALLIIERLEKENSELKGNLKQYEESAPPTGGAAPPSQATMPSSARDQVMQSLRKLAK